MQVKKRIIMALIAGVLLASCAGQATGEPTVDVDAVMTAGVGTFVAALTQTQAAQPATATPTASPTWTASPISLNSPTPPATSTQAFVLPLPTIFIAPTVTGTQNTPTVNP